jgi:hypothetical protein
MFLNSTCDEMPKTVMPAWCVTKGTRVRTRWGKCITLIMMT